MNTKKYLYNRSDFKPLPVKLEHMNICLNFADGRVEGTNILRMTARKPLKTIRLDARDLEIRSVDLIGSPVRHLDYDYQREKNALIVKLPERVEAGATFSIRTSATCVPSDNILEGIYKDTTPPGCPQQYMSQCEQWGFQRILPVLDDCTAKCTMVTTIEADARYTHLISNGNVSRKTNPDGKPALKPGNPSRKIITYENSIPMAPYLFIACVGTWDVLEDEITYPSGRRVKLEYLVPPGGTQGAVVPMKILKQAVLWQGGTQEYEYQREVYRVICMEKSNFGGMENVGNTTIITDAALIDQFTSDSRIEYAHGVIAHEFEHNQCGSDVTMETPFDMWLNEAFTVDVDRQFMASQFNPDCRRLDEIDSMRGPVGGPLAIEDGGHLGNIVRDGFNNPDELVDGVTYVKAAEVIRMLWLIVGSENFRLAKNLYFKRYAGGNANTDQFLACFEEVSKSDLSQFKREWLYTIGYPKVEAKYDYDNAAKRLRIELAQSRTGEGGLFHIPLEISAVDGNGADIVSTRWIVEMTGESLAFAFDDVPEPAFLSLNRNCSFYGSFEDKSATPEQLRRQITLDPNRFNRVEAMRRLTDIERVKLILDPKAEISQEWFDTYGAIVRDTSLPAGLKSYLLWIDEQSLNRDYLTFYRERCEARIKLLKAVAGRHLADLVKTFNAVDTYAPAVNPKDGIEERALKAVLLRLLIEANTPEVHKLAAEHFHRAWNITDKLSALRCINISEHPDRKDLLAEGYELWKDHLSAYSSYLNIVASGTHEDVFDMITAEEHRPSFKLEHPTHSRSLYLPMAGNNKMLWTNRGINWVAKKVAALAKINENTAIRLLACFQQVNGLADDLKPKVLTALEKMLHGVNEADSPSVAGRIKTYLEGKNG
jgi:aminopeptidase N